MARSRSWWRWVVVVCGVAALLTIQTVLPFWSRATQEYSKVARVMATQSPQLLNIQELHQVEPLSLLPAYALKRPHAVDRSREFLNESSAARNIFFPRAGAVDPRKKEENGFYRPGKLWLDTDGKPIQAHGGGVLYDEKSDTYYWYGEYKNGPTYREETTGAARVDVIGVGCYSSTDLWAWRFEGVVLAAEEADAAHDLYKLNVLERPKVIYNRKTGVYVMWMHIDDAAYGKAAVGVAVSDAPTGPFTYLGSLRPNGYDSRDMTVFADDDGSGAAYLVYASASNKEIHVSRLCPEFLEVSEATERVLVGMHREAPAVFKHGGLYYMVTSGSGGNEALVHEAESMMGPWETIGNPCIGANREFRAAAFFSQVSFVLPMRHNVSGEELFGDRGEFIFMADRWNPANLSDSRYVWLPLTVKARDRRYEPFPMWSKVAVFWHERWRPPIKDNGETYYVAKPFQYGDDL